MGLHWVTFFHSMQISSVAIGMISLFTFPIMVVFMEAAIHRALPHWRDIILVILVLIGIFLMSANQLLEPNSNTLTGILVGTLSALFFACRNVIQKYYFADTPSDNLMLHQTIAIALMLLAFIDFTAINHLTTISWLNLFALGLFTTAGAHTLLTMSYKKLPAKTVAMVSCSQPVLGALIAWVVIKEQPTIFVIAGGSIILAVAIYESVSNKQ